MSLQKIFENTGWLILEKIVRSIMTIFVGAVVIRHLGPDQYGQLAYTLAIIAIFQSIASLGLEGVVVREILAIAGARENLLTSDHRESSNQKISQNTDEVNIRLLISSAFIIRLLSGLCLLTFAILVTGVLNGGSPTGTFLTILLGGPLIFQAADIFDLWNQSRLNSKLTAILKIVGYIISNTLRILLVTIDAGLLWFAAAFLVEASIIGFGLYFTYTRSNKFLFDYKVQVRLIVNLVKETWPVAVASLSAAVYARIDQIVLGSHLGPAELGIYSAALLFASASYFLPGVICASVMPMAVKAKQLNVSSYIKIVRNTYVLLLSTSLSIFLITYLAADFIFAIFYTEAFDKGIEILKIYAITNIPVYLGVAHGLWMVNDRKIIVYVYRAFFGAVTAVTLCLNLVPAHGLIGAAYSTVTALIVSDVLVPIVMNFHFFKTLIKYRDEISCK